MKKIIAVLILLLASISSSAYAQQVVNINTGVAPYINQTIIPGAGITADIGIRLGALTQVVSTYRSIYGPNTLPVGKVIKVTWPDGTSEKATVVSKTASTMAEPIAGSQRDANGGSAGSGGTGGDGGSNPGGNNGSGGSTPIGGGCYGNCGGPVIIIGDIEEV